MDDITCLYCHATNSADAVFCANCERSLVVGRLTSLGTGVLTKGFIWDLRPTVQTMGRNIGNDFVIPSNLIAGEQLRFIFRDGGFVMTDVSKRGNCLVDGRPITDEVGLRSGATVKVGVEEFVYHAIKATGEKVTKVPDPLANQLQLMLGIISEFHASLNLQEVLDNAVDAVLRLTRTKRGYCFMVEETPDGAMELREVAARQLGSRPLSDDASQEYSISQSVIQHVLSGNPSIIVEDALAQNINTDTIRKFKLKSIICVPLQTFNHRTGQKHVMGIVYADSLMPSGELPKHSRSTLQMLADIITATIIKWRSYDKMEQLFDDHQRNLTAVQGDLQAITEQLIFLQEKVNDPDPQQEIARSQIGIELNAIESRVQAVWTTLQRLQGAPKGG